MASALGDHDGRGDPGIVGERDVQLVHTEGGRAPLARFEASLMGHDESAKDHFYSRNFARLFEAA